MLNSVKKELTELILLFFIIFFGLCMVDSGNREAIRKQAIYEAQFNYNFEVSTGFVRAMYQEPKYKPKVRMKRFRK